MRKIRRQQNEYYSLDDSEYFGHSANNDNEMLKCSELERLSHHYYDVKINIHTLIRTVPARLLFTLAGEPFRSVLRPVLFGVPV